MTKPESTLLFKVSTTFFVANLIADFGRDVPFSILPGEERYIPTIILSQALTFWIWDVIKSINLHLDKRYSWLESPLTRFGMQMAFSVIITAMLFLLSVLSLAFMLRGVGIVNRDMIIFETVVAMSFTLGVNILAVSRYLYSKLRETERVLERDFPYFPKL
jgi:hypothetical protein